MPVFAKPGAIVPMAEYEAHDNRLTKAENMTVIVFPGANGEFTLYEDAGDGYAYASGSNVKTRMTLAWGAKPEFTISAAEGDLAQIPEVRNWQIGLRGFHTGAKAAVLVDGKAVDAQIRRDGNTTWVTVSAGVTANVTVRVEGDELIHDNAEFMDVCEHIIQRSQIPTEDKIRLWNALTEDGADLDRKIITINKAVAPHASLRGAVWEMLELTDDRYRIAQIMDR